MASLKEMELKLETELAEIWLKYQFEGKVIHRSPETSRDIVFELRPFIIQILLFSFPTKLPSLRTFSKDKSFREINSRMNFTTLSWCNASYFYKKKCIFFSEKAHFCSLWISDAEKLSVGKITKDWSLLSILFTTQLIKFLFTQFPLASFVLSVLINPSNLISKSLKNRSYYQTVHGLEF